MIEQDSPKKIAEALVNHSEVRVILYFSLTLGPDPFPDFHAENNLLGMSPGMGIIYYIHNTQYSVQRYDGPEEPFHL